MKSSVLYTIIIVFTSVLNTNAQDQMGELFDFTGVPMNGYFDPISYAPQNLILFSPPEEMFRKGYYYQSNGKKVEGYFIRKKKKFVYTELLGNDQFAVKFKAKKIKNFVIGIDSFFAINNYENNSRIVKSSCFVELISEVNGDQFVRFPITNNTVFKYSYLAKKKDETVYYQLNSFLEDKEIAKKFFGQNQQLTQEIFDEEYESKDLYKIIKKFTYLHKAKNGIPIYFNEFWKEVNSPHLAKYQGYLKENNQDKWVIDFYENEEKLYRATFLKQIPLVKDGTFEAYYAEGSLKKTIEYEDNIPSVVKTYFRNGDLQNEFHLLLHEKEDKKFKLFKNNEHAHSVKKNVTKEWYSYTHFMRNGLPIDSLTKKLTFKDNRGVENIFHFENRILKKAFFIENGQNIYHFTNSEFPFDASKLQARMALFMEKNYDPETINTSVSGVYLVHVILGKDGRVKKAKRLNNLEKTNDILIQKFVDNYLLRLQKQKGLKLETLTIEGNPEQFSFVIPIEILTQKGLSNDLSPLMNYDHLFMHNNFITPSLPVGF
ncbi:MAG: hypothetical protein N4A45_01965 [Flavobacteriales bacterium]|jgi:hypothetical protein|nr:hypothetical protein [Flavobacteriales bacterium]